MKSCGGKWRFWWRLSVITARRKLIYLHCKIYHWKLVPNSFEFIQWLKEHSTNHRMVQEYWRNTVCWHQKVFKFKSKITFVLKSSAKHWQQYHALWLNERISIFHVWLPNNYFALLVVITKTRKPHSDLMCACLPCALLVRFRNWSMSVVGFGACGLFVGIQACEWRGGMGGWSWDRHEFMVLVGQIGGQGPLLHPQTKSSFCPF